MCMQVQLRTTQMQRRQTQRPCMWQVPPQQEAAKARGAAQAGTGFTKCFLQVEASLSCTAEGLPWLWVLHGAIEKIMLSQGRHNITALIDFFQREVDGGALTKQTQALVSLPLRR